MEFGQGRRSSERGRGVAAPLGLGYPADMHRVVVVAFDRLVPFDLAMPCEVFAHVKLPSGSAAYRVRVCGVARDIDAGAFRMRVAYGLSELARADTIIVPGVSDIDVTVAPQLIRALRRAAASGARIASICSGAFVLAAAGLLDGRRATTHWRAAGELARRFPRIDVDRHVLYVDDGQVLTSAGAAAGLDLCLHLVRSDHGAALAAQAARISVMPLEREGGQSQFIEHAPPESEGSLCHVLDWLERHSHEDLAVTAIARRAGMSVRSLSRHFKQQTGTTPLKWLLRARIRRAQVLLETTTQPIERIASSVGFGSAVSFREQFRCVLGTNPQSYRRSFRGAARAA
jgi:transcriptional regulator GlxA family with amidase domain